MSIRRTQIDGIDTAYKLEGRPGRPVVMFANSLCSDMTMWDSQAAGFSRNYQVLRYDMRGHGQTAEPRGPLSISDLAGDAIALMDHVGVERVHFVGLSLGGMVGQVLGASHGSRLASLTLCATASRMDPSVWGPRIAQVEREGIASIVAANLERWFTADFSGSKPDTMAAVEEAIRTTSVAGYVQCASAIRDMDLVASLGRITTPTLVIAGAEDPSTPPATAKLIHEAIAGSELAIIEDAAHLMNIEQPQVFDACLEKFLDRQERESLAPQGLSGVTA